MYLVEHSLARAQTKLLYKTTRARARIESHNQILTHIHTHTSLHVHTVVRTECVPSLGLRNTREPPEIKTPQHTIVAANAVTVVVVCGISYYVWSHDAGVSNVKLWIIINM